MFHDIREPQLILEKKLPTQDIPIEEIQPFDPRHFRPLMATIRVALHNLTIHLIHVKELFID